MSLFSKHTEENSLVLQRRLTIKSLFSGSLCYEVVMGFMAASILNIISLTFLRSFISLRIPMYLYLSLRLSLAPAHAAAKPSAYPQARASPEACTRLLSAWLMLTVCIHFSLTFIMRGSVGSVLTLSSCIFMPFRLSICLSVHLVFILSVVFSN